MIPGRSLARDLVALALALFWAWTACGHTTGLSTSDLRWETNGLNAQITMAATDLTLVLTSLDAANRVDSDADGRISREELTTALVRVREFAGQCLVVECDAQRVPATGIVLSLDDKENLRIGAQYLGERPARLRVQVNLFEHLPTDHMHFLSVEDLDGKALGNKMFRPDDRTFEVFLPGAGENRDKSKSRTFTFASFLKLGVEHIWMGYDHLLFLLALLLVCPSFKAAVQVVTFFTIAHSLTLAFATLNLVWVSGRVVEPLIAASIIYIGVENIARPDALKDRWLITFLFGLVHGFGFASVLRDLGVATNTTGVTVPLVAFNLGVEAGQVAIAGVLLPIIWRLRRLEGFVRWGVPACSAMVASAGAYWLIQRLWYH